MYDAQTGTIWRIPYNPLVTHSYTADDMQVTTGGGLNGYYKFTRPDSTYPDYWSTDGFGLGDRGEPVTINIGLIKVGTCADMSPIYNMPDPATLTEKAYLPLIIRN